MEILIFNSHKRPAVPAIGRYAIACTDVTFCFEGEMHYVINGEPVTLFAGDAIVMPRGTVRERLGTDIFNDYASFNVVFPDGYTEPISGVIRSAVNADTLYLVGLYAAAHNSDSAHKKQKCRALFSYLYHSLADQSSVKESASVVAVRRYVRDHLGERISLCDIAASVHLAPQYLSALFRKQTGVTVTDYIAKERIDKAKSLILTTNMRLSEISDICGFSDHYAFSHAFSRVEGVSASQYKKIKKAQGERK